MNKRYYSLVFLTAMIVLGIGYQLGGNWSEAKSQVNPTSTPVEVDMTGVATITTDLQVQDFTLNINEQESLSLSDLQGKNILLMFGYTHCEDVCPITLAVLRNAIELLGPDASQLQVVFVTVDSARDTPEVLTAYLQQFNPDFIGGTVSDSDLENIGQQFSEYFGIEQIVSLQDEASGDHAADDHDHEDEHAVIDHVSPVFFIDSTSYMRNVFFYGTQPQAIAATVQSTLVSMLGNAKHGEEIFKTFNTVAGSQCSVCHRVDSEDRLVGPGLLNVTRRIPAEQSAFNYLYTSIIEPSAYIVEGYTDIMPKNWEQALSHQDIFDLIAYLQTLGTKSDS